MMKLYSEDKNYKIYQGSMLDMLEVIEPSSIDSIVCDPPYELNFMNKGWDNSGIAFQKNTWCKCYDVLKSGGYLLAFGGTRTYHRIACAIEDAGFEIRDCIMWLYGSGFPKSMNIGLAIDKKMGVESEVVGIGKSGNADTHTRCMNSITQTGNEVFGGKYEIKKAQNKWAGWGTALKPAYEPIIVARKPVEDSVVNNVIKYGVGGINIDECRVKYTGDIPKASGLGRKKENHTSYSIPSLEEKWQENEIGRFPSNVILTYDDTDFNEVCGRMPNTKSIFNPEAKQETEIHRHSKDFMQWGYKQRIVNEYNSYNDSGSASRYFYCAKASKKDRDNGLDMFEETMRTDGCIRSNHESTRKFGANSGLAKNTHPTVKPIELMQYLVRLVTPKGGVVLDCFLGSGSTGKAVMFENRERNANYKFIGIELTDEYLPIAKARIDYAKDIFEYELKQKKKEGQLSIFDFMGEE